jgi:anaerobic ribonucleoside-triphosphate reductase activating protein
VPQTHPFDSGAVVPVDALVQLLLDPSGEPRDGVTILGGEPFLQPVGLAALLGRIKAHGVHTTVYTGYTLEALGRRPEPAVRVALELTDLLIDGPFVASLAQGAGEWRGSRNQRLIAHPSTVLSSMPNAVATP